MTRWFILNGLLWIGLSGCNPFAPALEEGDPFAVLTGDPRTIEGFFQNFKAAYELRDISLYEPLLDSAFVFVFYDYDAQVERQWGFSLEQGSLFRSSGNVNFLLVRPDTLAPWRLRRWRDESEL